MQITKPTWIHIAGNPAGVRSGKGHFWRYRVAGGSVYTIPDWNVTGTATSGNITQGVGGADDTILLWYAVYGFPHIDQDVLTIRLAESGAHLRQQSNEPASRTYTADTIKLFGAPDKVREGTTFRWRCSVGSSMLLVPDLSVIGELSPKNHWAGTSPDEEIANRRVYLAFAGKVSFYFDNRAVITPALIS